MEVGLQCILWVPPETRLFIWGVLLASALSLTINATQVEKATVESD